MTDQRRPAEAEETGAVRRSANPGYAMGQLARALTTAEHHPDPATRERAERRAATWAATFAGMLDGSITVGSRTPLAGVPAWVTPEVAQGGFATGALAAGGALRAHERSLLEGWPAVAAGGERAAIAAYYLSETGQAALRAMLTTGRYRLAVPEEAALLVVTWLLDQGHAERARDLLDQIGPFLSQLRFAPSPAERPLPDRDEVYRLTVGEVSDQLRASRPSPAVAAEREAVGVWAPLADRAVALWGETLVGAWPTRAAAGASATGGARPAVMGGWPGQHYPAGWRARAQALLTECDQARGAHVLCSAPDRAATTLGFLRRMLARAVADPATLTGREVGRIRATLADVAARRGQPGTPAAAAYRQAQRASAFRPGVADLAPVLVARLARWPADDGVSEAAPLLAPVTGAELAATGAELVERTAGWPLPPVLTRRLLRCVPAPLTVLIERGVIPSGEMLARLLPPLTARPIAAAVADPDLRRLVAATYAAFRRRRSLLLLDLSQQVGINELPWMAAIASERTANRAAVAAGAQHLLAELAVVTLTGFPDQIIPNPLVRELTALAEVAGLALPLTEELAADIFMGTFAAKFLVAARAAAELLADSLYARYYGLDRAALAAIDDVAPSAYGTRTSERFADLCYARAGVVRDRARWSVAANGAVIEQAQILTTHNLAALVTIPGVRAALEPELERMVVCCIARVLRHRRRPNPYWRRRLRDVKNDAYAWRQAIFYLSLLPAIAYPAAWRAIEELVAGEPAAVQARFQPALQGLQAAAAGQILDPRQTASGAGPLVGWSTGHHWLLAAERAAAPPRS